MTNEEIKQEIRDKIDKLICDWYKNDNLQLSKIVDQILSLSGEDWGLAIVKKNPELTNSNISNQDRNGETYAYYYNKAQQDMLKAGFRQEVK